MALTGGLVGGECYPSQAEALDAYYSARPASETPGATTYVVQYVKASGVWNQQAYAVDGSGVWSLRYSTAAPVVVFPACDPTESFVDGVQVGWMFAAVLVAVGAFKLMQRAAG